MDRAPSIPPARHFALPWNLSRTFVGRFHSSSALLGQSHAGLQTFPHPPAPPKNNPSMGLGWDRYAGLKWPGHRTLLFPRMTLTYKVPVCSLLGSLEVSGQATPCKIFWVLPAGPSQATEKPQRGAHILLSQAVRGLDCP
jgi:hypothetical protein